ncbi:MAG: tetratricopeptide repeat protein [Anaerolineae bacterium]|nr:tetratricopeptide repeat protein [Anaerolineae bacterium]
MTDEQRQLLAKFQEKIARNAQGWLEFLRSHRDDPATLDRELSNILRAAQMALAEAGAWEAGVALVQDAGLHMERRGHLRAWQRLLEQALRACAAAADDRPRLRLQRAALLAQLGEIARTLGDNAAALEHLQAALDLYRSANDWAGVGKTLGRLSQVYLAQADLDAATTCCEEAAELCAAFAPDDLGLVYNNWGLVCLESGDLGEAAHRLQQASDAFARTGNRRGQAKALNNLGLVYRRLGLLEDAVLSLQQAIELYGQVGDDVHTARTQVNLGVLYHALGRTEAALDLHRQVEPVFRRVGDRPYQARVANNEGVFLAALGRLDEAVLAFELAARLYAEIGDPLGQASALINAAEMLLDQGVAADAGERLRRAGEILNTLQAPPDWLRSSWEKQRARWRNISGLG